jgi:hypothetical protein
VDANKGADKMALLTDDTDDAVPEPIDDDSDMTTSVPDQTMAELVFGEDKP